MPLMQCLGTSIIGAKPNGMMVSFARGAPASSSCHSGQKVPHPQLQWKAWCGAAAGTAWLCGRERRAFASHSRPFAGARAHTRLRAVEGTKPEVAFVIGGPGSGKGTQCELAAKELGFLHLSAGELLRQERSREGSTLAKEIEEAMTAAKPVPSEVIAKLLEQAMREAGAWKDGPAARFVVDGYPRSEEQLRGFQAELSSKVQLLCCISLEVGREEMRQRLLGRAKSSGRVDDEEEVIEKRLNTFQADTDPLLDFFKAEGQLQKVNGNNSPDDVFQEVRNCLQAAEADC